MTDWRVLAVLYLGGILLTVARRWQNPEPNAGAGAAGGTIFLIGCYLLSHR